MILFGLKPRTEKSTLGNTTKNLITTETLFQEITIPYLRSRTYHSELATPTVLSSTPTHTTHLTSFDSDGFTVNALLTIPKGQKPANGWPGVVFIHGYIPPATYKTTSNYNSFVNAIASKNIIVLKIDLRGHGTSEGTASGSYYSSDYVIDTLNAYTALTTSSYVDPNNTSLWGHSMAGNIVLRSIAVNPKIPKAIIWAGAGFTYTDLQTLRISDNSYRPPSTDSPQQKYRQALFQTHGQFDPNSAFWKLVPATNFLAGIETKIQLHHAINDNVVSVEYSRNLNRILTSSGISSSLYEYSSGGHNLTGAAFTSAVNRTINLMKSVN